MWTKKTFGAAICLCFAMAMVGCGDENVVAPPAAPVTPPPGGDDDVPQLRSFELDLRNIDDAVQLRINGDLVDTFDSSPEARVPLDEYLDPGSNTLEVRLWNGGCFASSLDLRIFENGSISVPTRSYEVGVSHCGLQVIWIYRLNRETGIELVQ